MTVAMLALQADWRSMLNRISIPCLNIVGSKTACFNAKGVAYVGEQIHECQQVGVTCIALCQKQLMQNCTASHV